MERKLIDKNEFRQLMKLPPFPGNCLSKLTMSILRLNVLNRVYNEAYSEDPLKYIDKLFALRGNNVETIERELARIPKEGPFIIVCNHPFGGWDGMAILKMLLPIRPDSKVLTNFLLKRNEPVAKYLIAVNPFETHKGVKSSIPGLREMKKHVESGRPLVFFPSGEVSTRYKGMDRVSDRTWQKNILRFIYTSDVPVIPLFFKGQNSYFFHLLGKIHPLLRTIRLPAEMVRLKNTTVYMRIGSPVPVRTKEEFDNFKLFGSYIRAKTFALNTGFVESHVEDYEDTGKSIIDSPPQENIIAEIANLKDDSFLFEFDKLACYCATKDKIPNIFREISRLREVTFRQVGEGTGNSADVDKFDEYYHHLFIWDKEEQLIAGAYRVGFGKEIFEKYDKKGFYIDSLFKISKDFSPILKQSFELGRSFVTKQYQRKINSLFMLWKGILYLLMKNPEYRYLVGPVSISNLFAHHSKAILVEYFKRNHSDTDYKKMIKPRLEFTYTLNNEQKLLLEYCGNDIKKIDRLIEDIDPNGMKVPILFKKYVSQGAKLVSFNVDPDFNNAVDGFMVSDIKEIPEAQVKLLAKEFDDPSFLKRSE